MAIIKRLVGLYQKVAGKAQTDPLQSDHSISDYGRSPEGAFEPVVIPRHQHSVSRDDISSNALKVLYRLHRAGFEAYLVGGGVRDLLLGHLPKDFDVATNATPEEVRALFRNCRLVGRRFRLAHILFGRDVIEVATFRGHHTGTPQQSSEPADAASEQERDHGRGRGRNRGRAAEKQHGKQSANGMILRDNVYGNRDEDAERRDFTVNALYYNIADFSIVAYGGGLDDIKARRLRLIGDPETRYREDPVRMLRAVRFASKLGFAISEEAEAPLKQLAPLLKDIPAARLFDESLKLLLAGKAQENYQLLRHYDLFKQLFPQTDRLISHNPGGREEQLALKVLENTDHRIHNEMKVTPAFLFAALLWYPLEARANELAMESGLSFYDAFQLAMNDVLTWQAARIAVPKRFTLPAREIWQLQLRLTKRIGRRADRMLEHPRFRAAFDFLAIRGEVEGGDVAKLADWWQAYQSADEAGRHQLQKQLQSGGSASGNKRRRRRRKPRSAAGGKPTQGGERKPDSKPSSSGHES